MDTESKDIVQEQIKKLPKEVQEALASDELSTKIRTVGNNHHLHIDQIGALEDEVVLTIIGISEISDLPNQLMEQLNISKTDADALVDDINKSVFVPIQESMKRSDEKSVVMPSSRAAAAATPAVAEVKPIPQAATPSPTQTGTPLPTDMQITAPVEIASTPKAEAASNVPPPTMHEADVILSEPTVSMPPKIEQAQTMPTVTTKVDVPKASPDASAPSPAPIYKADPYREPIE